MSRRSLDGRSVAITGAARGIGRATAEALVAMRASVAVGDLDLDLAEHVAAKLGESAIALPLDVTDRASFHRFISEAERRLGPLDALINNAGIMPIGPFVEQRDESAHRAVDVNLHGVIQGTKLAIERMQPRRSGHIVNVASHAGKVGVPGVAVYSATKHAVVGLSESLRAELRGTGIEISCVTPAMTDTEMIAGVTPARGFRTARAEDVAAAIVRVLERPRFDVPVPRSAGVVHALTMILPRPAREAIARAIRIDRVMVDVDPEARRDYERRIAEAQPADEDRPVL